MLVFRNILRTHVLIFLEMLRQISSDFPLMMKSLMENFIFCAVQFNTMFFTIL